MIHTSQTRFAAFIFTLLACVAHAQSDRKLDQVDLRSANSSPNHFGFSYRPAFNVSVKFKNIGGYAPTDPGPATGGVNHEYDDGYNRVDSEGNGHGDQPNTTWYWGYENSSQHVGNTMVMHSSSTGPVSSAGSDQDIQHGFELTYNRELGRIKNVTWGVEGAINYMNLHFRDSGTLHGPINQTNDVYTFPSETSPPPAPYHSTFYGEVNDPEMRGGTLLGDIPIRSVNLNVGTASTSGFRQLEGNAYGFRVGPYVQIPLGKRVAVSASAGLAAAQIDGEFSFNNTVNLNGAVSPAQTGKSNHSEFLAGGYLAGNVSYEVCPRARLFAGVQWEDLGTYKQSSGKNSPAVEADFSQAIFLTVGVGINF